LVADEVRTLTHVDWPGQIGLSAVTCTLMELIAAPVVVVVVPQIVSVQVYVNVVLPLAPAAFAVTVYAPVTQRDDPPVVNV